MIQIKSKQNNNAIKLDNNIVNGIFTSNKKMMKKIKKIFNGRSKSKHLELNISDLDITYKNNELVKEKILLVEQEKIFDDTILIKDILNDFLTNNLINVTKNYLFNALNLTESEFNNICEKRLSELDAFEAFKLSIEIMLLKKPYLLIINDLDLLLKKYGDGLLIFLKDISNSVIVVSYIKNKNINNDYMKLINLDDYSNLFKGKIEFKNIFKNKNSNNQIKNKNLHNGLFITSLVTVFLSISAFIGVYSWNTSDINGALLKKQFENEDTIVRLTKQKKYFARNSCFPQVEDVDFSSEEINRISYFTNFISPMFDFSDYIVDARGGNYIDQNIAISLHCIEVAENSLIFQEKFEPYSKLSPSTSNSMPHNVNEIAISDLVAEEIVAYGVKSDNNKVIFPKNIDEIIGLKIYNGKKITGIFSLENKITKVITPFINKDNKNIINDNNYEEAYKYSNGFSISQCIYCYPGTYNLMQENSQAMASGPRKILINVTDKAKALSEIDNIAGDEGFINVSNRYNGFLNITHKNYFDEYKVYLWLTTISLLIIGGFAYFYSYSHIIKKNSVQCKSMINLGTPKKQLIKETIKTLLIKNTILLFAIMFTLMICGWAVNASLGLELYVVTWNNFICLFILILIKSLIEYLIIYKKCLK